MARPSIYQERFRTNVILEKSVYRMGAKRAFECGFCGGFSEYVARLINADLKNRKSAAHRASRFVRKARKAA